MPLPSGASSPGHAVEPPFEVTVYLFVIAHAGGDTVKELSVNPTVDDK